MKHNATALDFYYSSKSIENLSVFRRVCWKTLKEFNVNSLGLQTVEK